MPAPTRIEEALKRVRVMLGGEFIADTQRPLLVWELPYFPWYYIPMVDVKKGTLVETGEVDNAMTYTVRAGDRDVVNGARSWPESSELSRAIGFNWKKMDGWFEEEEEIFAHPHDPHHRIDVLRSSRHVEIEVDGVKVAESSSPVMLFETGLPARYYLSKTDVRMDLLTPVDDSSQCAYKGTARYWSLDTGTRVHPSFVWSYPFPAVEVGKIAGLVSFYNEKVDMTVDGRQVERPVSPFSSGRP